MPRRQSLFENSSALFWVAWAAGLLAGCGDRAQVAELPAHFARQVGELRELQSRAPPALLDELARLRSEGAWPLATEISPAQQRLARRIPLERVRELAAELDRLSAMPRAFAAPAAQAQALKLRSASDWWREPVVAAFTSANRPPLEIVLAEGPLADLRLLEALRVAAELELWQACHAASSGQTKEALASLQNALHLAAAVAAAPALEPRLAAADMRQRVGEALAVAIFPQLPPEGVHQLAQLFNEHVAQWTPDDVAWRGERARGLWLCELMARGELASALSSAELAAWQGRSDFRALSAASQTQALTAATEYLVIWRGVIAACQEPLAVRLALLHQHGGGVARHNAGHPRGRAASALPLEEKRAWESSLPATTPAEENAALAARLETTRLLLANCERALTLQALDRSRFQAWQLALNYAAGERPTALPLDEITGQPLRIEAHAHAVQVGLALQTADEEYVRLPLVAPDQWHLATEPPAHQER